MDERMKQRWLELSADAMDELVKWREANPLATFAQIEQQLDDRLADARARMLGDLAQATPAAQASASRCPECGSALASAGERRRRVRTRNQRRVELSRQYAVCPACSAGLFPPRPRP